MNQKLQSNYLGDNSSTKAGLLLVKDGELALLALDYCSWWVCWGGTVVWGQLHTYGKP
jgi:hypothetical protein